MGLRIGQRIQEGWASMVGSGSNSPTGKRGSYAEKVGMAQMVPIRPSGGACSARQLLACLFLYIQTLGTDICHNFPKEKLCPNRERKKERKKKK